MKPICSFLTKFASLFSCVLSCFDRVIFKGHLPICRADQLEGFVDYVLRLRRCDFMNNTAPFWSNRLVAWAKSFAQKRGRLFEYRQGDVDKDAWAKEQIERCAIRQGLVGVLCVMESCWTFKLGYAEGRPCFVSRKVPQRVLYYYFLDKDLGLMHVRLQTWAPFTCQIYVNGHDYVARQLARRGCAFQQLDNAFVQLSDAGEAQRQANRFAKLPWPKILDQYARQVNPLLRKELRELSAYWVINQAEFATDLLFVSKHALTGLFARLVEFAFLTFKPKRVFAFLGRKWHKHFDGEVHSRVKTEREPGVCIKHSMSNNRLKMYDKFGLILWPAAINLQPMIMPETWKKPGKTEA